MDIVATLREIADQLEETTRSGEVIDPQVFDFNDGLGPVSATRHTNPDGSIGGWVAATAWVSGKAWVIGEARV